MIIGQSLSPSDQIPSVPSSVAPRYRHRAALLWAMRQVGVATGGCQALTAQVCWPHFLRDVEYTLWQVNLEVKNPAFIDGLPIKSGDL